MNKASRPLPPLDLLPGFEAAARHLSFTKAAEELFLTQSAVSRQVLALEEHLGVALFERRHKAMVLTEAGQAYLRVVVPVLDQLREATRRARESRQGHVLTVTTTLSFAAMWLVPRLAAFRRDHPHVDVRIAASGDVLDMAREGIDVAIRDCALDDAPPGALFLAGEQVAPVCSPDYLAEAKAARRPLSRPEDLRHHVLLNVHDPGGRWPWISWETWCERSGLARLEGATTLTFSQYDQVMQAALHGQGIAMGRMTLVSEAVRRKQLVFLFDKRHRLDRGFHAIFAPGADRRPAARDFVAWMAKEVKGSDHSTFDAPGPVRK